MRVLIAPDKFKGTATARAVCAALAAGLREALPEAEIRQLPLADGGDGTLDVLGDYLALETIAVPTRDPLGRPLVAHYRRAGPTAYVELAAASGLVLLAERERDPRHTSTYGTGLLVADALARGCTDVVLLLGGSATHDLGLGIAEALGWTFVDADGAPVRGVTGGRLADIAAVHAPAGGGTARPRFTLWCDVDNPLLGARGAARVYAPQKGADAAAVDELERGGAAVAAVLQALTSVPLATMPGGGAAGGIAVGLTTLLGARLTSGFAAIRALADLDAAVAEADLVVTGEGQLDGQSLEGKVVGAVVGRCREAGTPCAVVVGRSALTDEEAASLAAGGAVRVHELVALAGSVHEAMARTEALLRELGRAIGREVAGGT